MKANKRKCLIIYNPLSGKGLNPSIIKKYHEILEEKGFTVDFVPTEYSSHAIETIKNADNYDIVFSIGGDGTLNEVITGNYQRENKLIICPLPSGTCNDVATMLGYGSDPIKNLNLALTGEINNIDIGTINGNPFAYVVGMGKLMNIPYETKSEEKRKNGYIAYLKEAITEILSNMKLYRAEITIDGEKIDGSYSLIMISNANHIAGINDFYKQVCLNDGLVEVLLCKAKTKTEFISNFLTFILGQKSNKIIYKKAHEVTIKLIDKPDKLWCIDGEKYDYDGMEYRVKIKDEMSFLTPSSKTKKLFKSKEGKICKTL